LGLLQKMRDFEKVTQMTIENLKNELPRMALAEIAIVRETFVGLRDDLRMSDMTGYYGDERDRNEQELEEKIRLCEMEYDWRAYGLLNGTVSTEIN
jgi:hypothetical protein